MSQELPTALKSSSLPDCVGLSPQLAFKTAMQKLQSAGKSVAPFADIKALLRLVGFSQNSRNRILHLSAEEIGALCKSSPKDDELWRAYVSELQALLSKMDQARKIDSCLGRPYVTAELASTVCKLARLRYLDERGFSSVQVSKLRDLLLYDDWCKSLAQLIGMGQAANSQICESSLIKSAICLLELYRDELLMPPRLKSWVNFDDVDLHAIETGDFSWMDDGGKSYLEDIRDVPLVTHYDELPHFDSVLDWFIASKPALNNNQVKRGWNYLEKLSEEWHQHEDLYGLSEEQIYEYPSWNCAVADLQEDWLSAVPHGNVYKLVPLITPHQLLEETKSMHHCVAAYLDDCISGKARIFSVRDSISDQSIATVELVNRSGLWEVAQLKGKHNRELIYRTYVSGDPLAIILDALVKWYNECAIK